MARGFLLMLTRPKNYNLCLENADWHMREDMPPCGSVDHLNYVPRNFFHITARQLVALTKEPI